MATKHLIYKKDNWNMLFVETKGRTLTVREISDQWGEECHTFVSRAELMNWAARRFPAEDFVGREEEHERIMAAFRNV